MQAGELAGEILSDSEKTQDYEVVVAVPRVGPGKPFDLWTPKRYRKDTKNGRLVIELDSPIEDTGA